MKKDLSFRFVRASNVTTAPVTGAWVYETPRGMLVDLYFERPQPTLAIKHAVSDDGTLGPEKSREIGPDVIREILASVEMTPDVALAIGNYLVELAKKQGAGEAPADARPSYLN